MPNAIATHCRRKHRPKEDRKEYRECISFSRQLVVQAMYIRCWALPSHFRSGDMRSLSKPTDTSGHWLSGMACGLSNWAAKTNSSPWQTILTFGSHAMPSATSSRKASSRSSASSTPPSRSHSRSRDTVVVASCLGLGARIAQEKLGVPLVTVHLQPAVIPSRIAPPTFSGVVGPRWLKSLMFGLAGRLVIDRMICPEVNRFRQELGLPPVRQIIRWWHSPQLVVCLFPEWFAPPQSDWPKNLLQTDFPLWDERTDASLAPGVQEFLAGGEPPIVFTPGSANVFGRPFFQAAIEACQRLGRRGILLTRFLEHVPGLLPSSVKHFPYIPFGQLLPKVAALVHHGGIGSTAQALATGIPQLVMPLAHDQFDNAARVKRLGVGAWLMPSRFRGPVVTTQLDTLLGSEVVQAACRRITEKFWGRAAW